MWVALPCRCFGGISWYWKARLMSAVAACRKVREKCDNSKAFHILIYVCRTEPIRINSTDAAIRRHSRLSPGSSRTYGTVAIKRLLNSCKSCCNENVRLNCPRTHNGWTKKKKKPRWAVNSETFVLGCSGLPDNSAGQTMLGPTGLWA